LLEVVGDHVGEEFPEAAPEGIGAGKVMAAGGIEGGPGVDEGDGIAAFAAEAFDVALGEEAGPAGAEEMGLDAELRATSATSSPQESVRTGRQNFRRAWGWMMTSCSMGS
jgi:hypothetical protein